MAFQPDRLSSSNDFLKLKIDTSNLDVSPFDAPPLSPSRSSSSPGGRNRSFSTAILPSFRISTSPSSKSPVHSRSDSAPQADPSRKYRDESRKLLTHILGRLQSRPKPPSVFDAFRTDEELGQRMNDFRTVAVAVQSVVKFKANRNKRDNPKSPLLHDDSDSDSEDVQFSTDVTFDLMVQLVSALAVAVKGNWQIFDDEVDSNHPEDLLHPPNTHHSRSRSKNLHSRPLSSSGNQVAFRGSELLGISISILSSIISDDCRFQISSPRPSRPPNSLQSVALDVASYLICMHRRNPKVLSQVGFALLPAFYTFKSEMHLKLLAFFEDTVIRPMLDSLRQAQGASAQPETQILDPALKDVGDTTIEIRIEEDEVEDLEYLDNSGWKRWSSSPQKTSNLPSSKAPSQPLAIYYLSSIIPSLLEAILENIDITDSGVTCLSRFYRLFGTIIDRKPDVYLDVLEVVAYSSPRARRAALALLTSYWPKGLGHGTIAKSLPVVHPPGMHDRVDHPTHSDPYDHQFVPWRFDGKSRAQSISVSNCRVCDKRIYDFGLLCPFCFCAVHFNCYDYPEGSCFSQYSLKDSNSERIAVHRFCHVLPPRRHVRSEIRKLSHSFRYVNLFTICLCALCKKPLWGGVMQGLKCTFCNQFVHTSCLSRESFPGPARCGSRPTEASSVVIDWSSLRHSFVDHYKDFISILDQHHNNTYEEVSILFAALWTQLQILHNGVALGSIVVGHASDMHRSEQRDEFGLAKFELHYLIQLCESYLTSGKLSVASTLENHFEENGIAPEEHFLCSDWATLAYITTAVKSPPDITLAATGNSSELLSVSQPEGLAFHLNTQAQDSAMTYEVASLAHIRDTLGTEFNIASDAAARHIMTHLQILGFFERIDLEPLWQGEDATTNYEIQHCNFPLPLGLELSNQVETLAAAIEACLSDLDLSVNEVGLVLLVRRFWYDGMMTQSALARLARCVLSWIFAEDDSLATILRDYVPKGRAVPGVRLVGNQPWPSSPASQQQPVISSNNGRVYIEYRRDLSARYAARWMRSLHDYDSYAYSVMLFQLSADLTEETTTDFAVSGDSHTQTNRKNANIDKHLRSLIKLGQSSIIFSVFGEIFSQWLELLTVDHRQSYPTLTRLFQKEQDTSGRSSTIADSPAMQNDVGGPAAINPWQIIMKTASASKDGLSKALRWLCIVARSGVDIPTSTFAEFLNLTQTYDSSWEESSFLVEALFCATWLRSMGRQELQSIISSLHSRLCPQLLDSIRTTSSPSQIVSFVRHSLVVCLLLYGWERDDLISLGLVKAAEIANLPSRRKLNIRGSRQPDFVGVDSALIDALQSYVQVEIEEITILVAQFLNMLISEAPLFESFEIDNVILRNGVALAACAWEFYGSQTKELTAIRPGFLVRLLVVDTEPLQELWEQSLSVSNHWEQRLEAVLRLFQIILDVKAPAFSVDDRQWRPSVIGVFYHYFSGLWADENEEIRLAIDAGSQTLLPAHFDVISACWNEALTKTPIAERLKLVTFLIQLLPHFPRWQVLPWNTLIETLPEDDYAQRMGDDVDGPAAAHLSMYSLSSKDATKSAQKEDKDAILLREYLVLLALQMICCRLSIDLFSLLRIKIHLARSFGFKDVVEVPSANGQAFYVQYGSFEQIPDFAISCLDEVMNVLDVYYPYELAPSAIGGPYADDGIKTPLLVGSVFVDLLLSVFNECDLEALPVVTVKNVVKCLMIIAYKHDLESKPLRHLQNSFRMAIRRIIDLFTKDISYEIRHLALSACQACIRRWPNMVGSLIYDSLEAALKAIVLLENNVEDELVTQARSFIETILTLFSSQGLFNALCKRHLDPSFFIVLREILDKNAANKPSQENLRDLLLRDTLPRATDNDTSVFQLALDNLSTYVEVVHHTGYSAPLMQFVGLSLTNITRRTAEWSYDSFDSTPVLLISSTLIRHNIAQSRELLMYLENILRTTLSRFHASAESLKSIFRVTYMLYKRYNAQSQRENNEKFANEITMVVFEIFSDMLRGKARIPPSTLTSIVEVVVDIELDIPTSNLIKHAEDGIQYLLTYSFQETYSLADFAASEAITKLVVLIADRDPASLDSLILTTIIERPNRQSLAVRAWNFLALAALRSRSKSFARVLLMRFQSFATCFQMSLQYQLPINAQESTAADINRAYVALKLWLLIAQDVYSGHVGTDAVDYEKESDNFARNIWNELWPPFERVVMSFENDARNGNVSPVAILTWSSVADLFLFLRQAHVIIALETSSQLAILNRLRNFLRGDSSKFTRVVRSISSFVDEVSFESLLNQAASDMLAAEKLHALESMKEGVAIQDRSRRETRIAS